MITTAIKKRILIISPFCPPSVGGAETHLQDLYDFLRFNGYFVYVLTYQPITMNIKGQALERKENIEIHRFRWIGNNLFLKLEKFPPIFNFLYLTPYLLLRSFIFLCFNHKKIDTIHVFGLNASFIARILKSIFRKKALMSTQALYCFKPGTLFARVSRWVLSGLDKVIAESVESRDEIIKIGVPVDKVIVFSHWVDQEKFKPRPKLEAKQSLGWQDKFAVLFVGRAIPVKGARLIVEVAKTEKNANFVIISDAGPEVEYLRRSAEENKNIIFIEGVEYKDLWRYYNAADVFVIPSQYEEGVARVMLESLSSGTAIIGSKRGSIPTVLNDSVSILVEPRAEEIKEAVDYLYNNPGKLKELSSNARNYALERFSTKNIEVITNNY